MLNFTTVRENSMRWQHVHTYHGCSDNDMRKSTELRKTGFLTCLGTTGFSSVHETKVLWQSMQMCLLLSVSSSAEGMHLATTNESKSYSSEEYTRADFLGTLRQHTKKLYTPYFALAWHALQTRLPWMCPLFRRYICRQPGEFTGIVLNCIPLLSQQITNKT